MALMDAILRTDLGGVLSAFTLDPTLNISHPFIGIQTATNQHNRIHNQDGILRNPHFSS